MLKKTGIIFDIKHFAIHDGPGIRTTVFFKGCPLSCWWCHNPESKDPNPEEIEDPSKILSGSNNKCGKDIIGREVQVLEVMEEFLKDVIFYDESDGGVTFSGGESLMQPAFLSTLLKECKRNGLHTCIDTSGYASKQIIDTIIPDVDLFLYDLKLMNNEEHEKYTGVGNEIIMKNLEYLCEKQKKVIIRIPIIPEITDTDENILQLGEYISRLDCILRVDLLPYNQMGEEKYRRLEKPYLLNNITPPSQERMFQIKEKLETYNLNVKIGG
ncbi:MAG: glycyl-radical enzyme activating protein [Candidatus Heimdallarchaeaceae archaeon]